MAKRYTLRRTPPPVEPLPLDRPRMLRALSEVGPVTRGAWVRRYTLRRLTQNLATSQRYSPADWLWLAGVNAAVAGWECPPGAAPGSDMAEGWDAGRGLLPRGMPVELVEPLRSTASRAFEARPWEG